MVFLHRVAEVLDFGHLELADSDQARPRRNLVSESISDLCGCKGESSLVELKEPLEVDKDALGSFRTEKSFHSTRGADICLDKRLKVIHVENNT